MISDSLQLVFTLSQGVVKGLTYRFKYRVRNQLGGSDFSDITYILAANAPSKPPAPTVVATSDTQIDLQFMEPVDNGGSLITSYELYMNEVLVAGYTSNLMTYSVTQAIEGITAGSKYYFKILARNAKGAS